MLRTLEENLRAREDDFILYGGVLKRLGVDLRKATLYDFLATAKENGIPSFETVTRCRRHIQQLRTDLVGKVAVKREDRQEDFINYNLTGIGE